MSYFKYGDVVKHEAAYYTADGEWVVIDTKDYLKSQPPRESCLVTVTNQREKFSCDEQFLTLIRPTPEERAREKLGEDYL